MTIIVCEMHISFAEVSNCHGGHTSGPGGPIGPTLPVGPGGP